MSDSEKDQLRKLFEDYEKKQDILDAAKAKVEEAMSARSIILQSIIDLAGPGPYNRGGQVMKIVKRGDTLFFRGRGEKEVIEV